MFSQNGFAEGTVKEHKENASDGDLGTLVPKARGNFAFPARRARQRVLQWIPAGSRTARSDREGTARTAALSVDRAPYKEQDCQQAARPVDQRRFRAASCSGRVEAVGIEQPGVHPIQTR